MNRNNIGIITVALVTIGLSGCSSNEPKPNQTSISEESTLRSPTKDILVTEGDISQPYKTLGSIEHTWEGVTSFRLQSIKAKEGFDELRREAFTKYGDKVDAIVNAKLNIAGYKGGPLFGAVAAGVFAPTVIIQIAGIAVSFQDKQSDENAPASEQPATKAQKKKATSHKAK